MRRELPDLLVLDLMLPGSNGLEICRRLESDPVTRSIAVVMPNAKGEETDLVLGLESGPPWDTDRHLVLVDGRDVPCASTELRLLHSLASQPGRGFTRDQRISRAIGDRAVVLERNIDVHVLGFFFEIYS